MNFYSKLLSSNQFMISEGMGSYQFIRERHVQVLWYEQIFFQNLTTAEGEEIEVISPGIWNLGEGPDFCRAHLKMGKREYRGDIEIHLSDDSWLYHKHHQDPRYNKVILHLSLWKPQIEKPIYTSSGKTIIRAYLEESLEIAPDKIANEIDLDLYPYKEFLGSGKCAQSLFQTLSDEKISLFFQSAAEWRLEQKIKFLETQVTHSEFLLGGGVAMALGYKHNSQSFLDLFSYLISYRDLPEIEIYSIALGICGFFEDKFHTWESSDYYRQTRSLWYSLKSNILHQTQLTLNKIRPFNHPIRRLAYLSKLISNQQMDLLESNLLNAWNSHWIECYHAQKWNFLQHLLFQIIPSFQDSHWNSHYLFEEKKQTKHLTLIGHDLKQAIVLNTFLPYLFSLIRKNGKPSENEAFLDFFKSFPAAPNSKTKYLSHRFFGETPKKRILNLAQSEQGAYQLHKDFCLHFEASCVGCPFVERYQKLVRKE